MAEASRVTALLVIAVLLVGVADAQQARLSCDADTNVTVTELDQPRNGTVRPGCQANVTVASSALQGSSCQRGYAPVKSWLLVEVWDLTRLGETPSTRANGSRSALFVVVAAQGARPSATFSADGRLSLAPATASADQPSVQLRRPYQQVEAPISSKPANNDSHWYLTIQNSALQSTALDYQLRVTCQTAYTCPAPLLNVTAPEQSPAPCAGHGTCLEGNAAVRAGYNASKPAGCRCDAGWADVGCNVPAATVANNGAVKAAIPPGDWAYYQITLPDNLVEFLVELNRTAGDPVLLVKPASAGFQAGALPSVQDYANFSDSASFRERLDQHHILLLRPKPGLYYIGVFNNDIYLEETAQVSLSFDWVSSRGEFICPFNCNNNGRCLAGGICRCLQGNTGAYCEGSETALAFKQPVQGNLQPGRWAFFSLMLAKSDDAWQSNGIELDFVADGGHPVLLAKQGGYPTLLDNDFIFRSEDSVAGQQVFRIASNDLSVGTYIFGLFNMNYFRHETFSFQLQVSQIVSSKVSMTPYFSIVIGVAMSLLFCICFAAVKRFNRSRRRNREFLVVQLGSRREAAARGVPAHILEAFPCHEYQASEDSEAAPPVAVLPVPTGTSDGPQHAVVEVSAHECSICLCEYVEGELVCTLPCRHKFHRKCVDTWLHNHSTCCICRSSVLPPQLQQRSGTPRSQVQAAAEAAASPNLPVVSPDAVGDTVPATVLLSQAAAESEAPHWQRAWRTIRDRTSDLLPSRQRSPPDVDGGASGQAVMRPSPQ